MEKFAIISLYDKSGIDDLAAYLVLQGYKILSTGKTADYLEKAGIEVKSISSYTNHPEILDGRVKSLHPKIHGGILARRDFEKDLLELQTNNIGQIDFVVVNLYPFTKQVQEVEARGIADHQPLVELIDIGGPTMIRAAAKNCRFVTALCDPADYQPVMDEHQQTGGVSLDTRRRLAAKVFRTMAAYDGAVARYFALNERLLNDDGTPVSMAPVETLVLEREMGLRYGENPHQTAGFYRRAAFGGESQREWEQLQGKELSYNNLLDAHGALELLLDTAMSLEPDECSAVIIKHSNPCGAAIRSSLLDAFVAARQCDPVSAFGGIIALSSVVTTDVARAVIEGFVEVVLAPGYDAGALETFSAKKNVRLLKIDLPRLIDDYKAGYISVRNALGGYLVQGSDSVLAELGEVICGKMDSGAQQADLKFAWALCKHVKSNAIVIVKNRQAIGVGAGQMSRVDAARIAIQRAALHGHDIRGAAAASDAFLPFADTLEVLHEAGVTALVQPGGSLKDAEVAAVAKDLDVTMVLTHQRHFRH